MRGLSNKVAIVTGGATLIGARVAKKLAGLKVSVVIADIDEKGGGEAARASVDSAVFPPTNLRS
jgi:NAD(P)-dependent dehydrogenase (short-subunit alcohol dehydrogenase family)